MSAQIEYDALLDEIMDMHPASCAIKLSDFADKLAKKNDALAARCEALADALRRFLMIDDESNLQVEHAHAAPELNQALHEARALLAPKQETQP